MFSDPMQIGGGIYHKLFMHIKVIKQMHVSYFSSHGGVG